MYFNPRTREGCDNYGRSVCRVRDISIHAPAKGATGRADNQVQLYRISIHAPAKGATIKQDKAVYTTLFQSTHPRRVRRTKGARRCFCLIFQSTHPRRVRPAGIAAVAKHMYFNPRTREGCDGAGRRHVLLQHISIHAPAKGATGRGNRWSR